MSKVKTDNRSLATKVEMRRQLLERMGISRARVLDTCTGAGHIWRTMKKHIPVDSWIRCDIKPRQGQGGVLAMTATAAVAVMRLDTFNVIDIDPYGEPWEPFRIALVRINKPTAFFLTHGHVGHSRAQHVNLEASGLPVNWPIPRTPSLVDFLATLQLRDAWRYGTVEHATVVRLQHVSYYALGVTPERKVS